MGRQLGLESVVIPCFAFVQGRFLEYSFSAFASAVKCALKWFSPLPFSHFAAALHFLQNWHSRCLRRMTRLATAVVCATNRGLPCDASASVMYCCCIGDLSNLAHCKFCSKRQADLL